MKQKLDRKHPARQPIVDIGQRSNIVFVTVCTKDRRHILDNETSHHLLVSAWEEADAWRVGRYIILPDHVHLFCAPAKRDTASLYKWITYWKALVTKSWPNPRDKPLWQRDAWDRQLRRGDSYTAKWEYVRNNPVRHHLVNDASEWPYQGELHVLQWHDI